jgi:L-amino acid N-acyltransferase YncA
MIIRKATHKDLRAINEIYNESIPSHRSTADTVPYSPEERKEWFLKHDPLKYPVFVAEDGSIVKGYASYSPYRPRRAALRYAAEISYFVGSQYQGAGIGTMLLDCLVKNAADYDFRSLIAILLAHNEMSIILLKKFGFEEWGRMPGIVVFGDREYDHLFYGLKIPYTG